MKNSIGKPCEGKLQARFDEGGADSLVNFTNLVRSLTELSGSTLLLNYKNDRNRNINRKNKIEIN